MFQFFSKIPIFIQPIFFVVVYAVSVYISFSFQEGLFLMDSFFLFSAVILSVFVHEMGHAIVAAFFRSSPKIIVTPFFPLTLYEVEKVGLLRQTVIMVAGPFMTLVLFVLSYYAGTMFPFDFVSKMFFVNYLYLIFSMTPMLPFDAGHILRIYLEKFFASFGLKASFVASMVISAFFLTYMLFKGYIIGVLFFGIYFIQNVQLFRSIKGLSDSDQKDENKQLLFEGEVNWQQGNLARSKELFNALLERCEKGYLHNIASEHLASLAFEEKNIDLAYNILTKLGEDISDNAVCLLYNVAYQKKDFKMVCSLSDRCYKIMPTEIMALNNARAFAYFNDSESAGGWLSAALEFGNIKLDEVVQEELFKNVKGTPEFLSFFDKP